MKKTASIIRDFILAFFVAFTTGYLIEWIFPCEQVTSSHLSSMTMGCFLMIRKYPVSSVYNLIFSGQMESRNYNNPSVCGLRHVMLDFKYLEE